MISQQKYEFAIVQSLKEDISSADVISQLFTQGEQSRDFIITRADNNSISSIFRDIVVKRGISENINFHITCDAIFHPGIAVNEKENIIVEMIGSLNGTEKLFVTDPYIYTNSNQESIGIVMKMIKAISSNLREIVFFHQKKFCTDTRSNFECRIKQEFPSLSIINVETDFFHDRFWIAPEENKGIVIGTSLNGLAKKICLLDYLNANDVNEIATLANQILIKTSIKLD